MKSMVPLILALALGAPVLGAEDAATQERLNKLAGQVQDLRDGQEALRRQVETIVKELESLREQMGKPTGNYASQDDVKRLGETLKAAVNEVDRKRQQDAEKIQAELSRLATRINPTTPAKRSPPPATESPASNKSDIPDKGFEYVVKKGDTLSIIVQAYRDNNIKVTTEQVLKANPGLKPEKLQVGQKIFIPAPQS